METIVTVALGSVVVGDVIVFGWDVPAYDGAGGTRFHEVDRDAVVAVDERGVHFGGGTYLAAADAGNAEVLVAVSNPQRKTGWWNLGDAVVQWALDDPAVI